MNILTVSTVFPNAAQPLLGLFIRERMRHVARKSSVRVMAPVAWSPFDPLVRMLKPAYRPASASGEYPYEQIHVRHPRVFSIPGLFKSLDGLFYYASLAPILRKIPKIDKYDLIDAHFAYPDGLAAALIANRLKLPFTVTLRGTEVPLSASRLRRIQMKWVFKRASRIICVSESLASTAIRLSADPSKIRVIPNGVDLDQFKPQQKTAMRNVLKIRDDAVVLLTVGGLVPRKGFHRVIEILPKLIKQFPNLIYLIVGGTTVEGDFAGTLRRMVVDLNLEDIVRFEGAVAPDRLSAYYSAADLFVLPTSNEGWANVLMESLACGTPVVTTDVGGNREVVGSKDLGLVVPFGNSGALLEGVRMGLARAWDKEAMLRYTRQRSWNKVAAEVLAVFEEAVHSP